MKINSEKLWDYIFNLATDEKVKFKVYCDDVYSTEILWNGKEFEWASGTFSSGAFFNPFYDFVPIEEEKEIEKINLRYVTCNSDFAHEENGKLHIVELLNNFFRENDEIINELIDEVNKLKELNK